MVAESIKKKRNYLRARDPDLRLQVLDEDLEGLYSIDPMAQMLLPVIDADIGQPRRETENVLRQKVNHDFVVCLPLGVGVQQLRNCENRGKPDSFNNLYWASATFCFVEVLRKQTS